MNEYDQVSPDLVSLQYQSQEAGVYIDGLQQQQQFTDPSTGLAYTPQNTAEKNQINGYAGLDSSGKIPMALISLTNANNKLSADVALTLADTFYDGPSISLAAGTWIVICQLTFGRSVAAVCEFTGRISDGTTHHASGQVTAPSAAHYETLTLVTVITLGSTTTIKGQAACNTIDGSIIKAANSNASGNNSSQISAVRIG